MALLKELDRQNRSQAPKNIEVIPLDDIPSGGGRNHASEIGRYSADHDLFLQLIYW